MIEIIAGEKGKGKTKYLLDKVNRTVKTAKGSIVYLDKSPKHMYELNNRIRLIDVAEFQIVMNLWDFSVVFYLRIMIWKKCIWTAFLPFRP